MGLHRKKYAQKGRGEEKADPDKLPLELKTALDALYGHYEKVLKVGKKKGFWFLLFLLLFVIILLHLS